MKKQYILIAVVGFITLGFVFVNYFRGGELKMVNKTPPTDGAQVNIDSVPSNGAIQATIYEVPITNFAFNPKTLTINKGDTAVWTNNDSAPHDVIGTNNKILSSPTLRTGQTYSFTFTEAGTFEYFCSIHPSMKGSVVVK